MFVNVHVFVASVYQQCVVSALGTAQEFKRKFETPIMRGRDAAATDNEHRKGEEKLQEVRCCVRDLQTNSK